MSTRTTMGGKRVFFVNSRIINLKSGFEEKLLCDGPTFTAGTACQYKCSFCYVPAMMHKSGHVPKGMEHEDVVVRRRNPVESVHAQLHDSKGRPRFSDPDDHRVIYASPLVDVASNMELVNETIAICKEILIATNWHIRLLSKSNLLPKIAQGLTEGGFPVKARVIFGVSTGTIDDDLAKVFEEGTALVSKRIQSLHWLQDNGFRTFGMICPSLPLANEEDYRYWARQVHTSIRSEKCEHIWAEVLNIRGDSTQRTVEAIRKGGFDREADLLEMTMADRQRWEEYARITFKSHRWSTAPGKLRFLQYVNNDNIEFWKDAQANGAILLGKFAHEN